MSIFTSSINSTLTAFAGGVAGVPSKNLVYRVSFDGAWAAGDVFKFNIITSAQTIVCGSGWSTGIVPVRAITLKNRVHYVAGKIWYFSDNNDASAWEQQAPGAGYIDVSNNWQESEALVSLAPYQGSMAVFSQRTVQIWIMDANPLNFALKQVLTNIGSYCPLGPQSIGDLDVIFPSTTGLRSLRVRDASLNAFVNDIGSPIDRNIQTAINAVGNENLSNTCSIVEPSANRYWHFINGVLFVLSYFPAAQIQSAWSTYITSDNNNKLFIPTKFITFQSMVYVRGSQAGVDHVFIYGGLNGATYDASVATAATSWLDLKAPVVRKTAQQLDYVLQGSWQFFGSMDWQGVNKGAPLKAITSRPVSQPSLQNGQVGWSDDGFHVKMQAVSAGNQPCILSSLIFHFQKGAEK